MFNDRTPDPCRVLVVDDDVLVGQGASAVDPVTGAYDLAYLTQHLRRELARSRRYGHCLSILRCDMDGFDAFCEQRGHGVGDELMREFVACAMTRIRKGDWFARASRASVWIVLPETAAKGAQCAAKQFLKLFELQRWAGLGQPVDVSVSVSVTTLDIRHDDRSAVRVASMLRASHALN
jgi:diguanylate cyclase (GGDEF)-like protein